MGTIVQMQSKKTGENQYPRTYTKAVMDDNATPLDTILQMQDDNIGVSDYPEYSESETCSAGDVRKHSGYLYTCIESTTGAWDATKWKQTNFKTEMDGRLSELGFINTDLDYMRNNYSPLRIARELVGYRLVLTSSGVLNQAANEGTKILFFSGNIGQKYNITAKTNNKGILLAKANGITYGYNGEVLVEKEGNFQYEGVIEEEYPYILLCVKEDENSYAASDLTPKTDNIDFILSSTIYDLAIVNYFDANSPNIIEGKYLANSSGSILENETYAISDYIPFTEEQGKMICSVSGKPSGGGGFIVLYDINKTPITGYTAISSKSIATWQDGVCYVRFSIQHYKRGKIQIEVGTDISKYAEYNEPILRNILEVDKGSSFYRLLETGLFTANLFNKDDEDIIYGSYLSDSHGNTRENDNYMITGYIPFFENYGKLIASTNGVSMATAGGFVCLYDEHKNVITGYQESLNGGIATWQDNVAYARFSIANYKNGNVQVEIGESVTPYKEYQKLFIKSSIIPSESKYSIAETLMGSDAARSNADNLQNGDFCYLNDYPYFIKKGLSLSFKANITSFNALRIGKGYQQYRGCWLEIDNQNVSVKYYESSVSTKETVPHGLNITDFISIAMYSDDSGKMLVIIQSKGGYFTTSVNWGYESNYSAFAQSIESDLTNVVFNGTNKDFRKPVWALGDSYFGVSTNRWVGVIREFGFFNFLIDGLAGLGSAAAYAELNRLLKYGTPKYLLWCLGMNDTDSAFTSTFESVKSICFDKNIELIAATIPTVPTRDKEAITQYVKDSGVRYIDFYAAVGADSDGNWHNGYLSSDGVHPTAMGAQALAMQVLIDFPEIMQYGLVSTDSEIGDITGDL